MDKGYIIFRNDHDDQLGPEQVYLAIQKKNLLISVIM